MYFLMWYSYMLAFFFKRHLQYSITREIGLKDRSVSLWKATFKGFKNELRGKKMSCYLLIWDLLNFFLKQVKVILQFRTWVTEITGFTWSRQFLKYPITVTKFCLSCRQVKAIFYLSEKINQLSGDTDRWICQISHEELWSLLSGCLWTPESAVTQLIKPQIRKSLDF